MARRGPKRFSCGSEMTGVRDRIERVAPFGSKPEEKQRHFDFLIVGGGSAGGVLASRLSEDPDIRVLLIEAGPEITEETMPEAVRSPYPGRAYFDPRLTFPKLQARLSSWSGAVEGAYEQGRGLGGGSIINGIGSNRGSPADYDEWQAAGAVGWSWEDVLPVFRKLETDRQYGGDTERHGSDGPWPIGHIDPAGFTGFTRALHRSLAREGYLLRKNQNGDWQDGVFPIAVNLNENNQRASIPTTYLRKEVRRRPNLTIYCDTSVEYLLFDGNLAVGAMIRSASRQWPAHAREVILCAGALHTPALLLRSGVGPARDLQSLGIPVVADNRGVGGNLMEHPSIGVTALLRPGARLPADTYHIQSILRWSSRLEGTPSGDMHIALAARASWHAVGEQLGVMFSWVNKSYSTGQVTLRSADPSIEPKVDFRMLSDTRDRLRLAQSLRLSIRTLARPEARQAVVQAVPSSYSQRIKTFLVPTRRNAVLTAIAAPLMDHVSFVRDQVLRVAQGNAPGLDRLAYDDGLLDDFVMRNVGGVWHPCGTAKMGRQDDPSAVTAPDGTVYGVRGLRVCDASLMPTIPCANLNLPVLMMAEKIAVSILTGRAKPK